MSPNHTIVSYKSMRRFGDAKQPSFLTPSTFIMNEAMFVARDNRFATIAPA